MNVLMARQAWQRLSKHPYPMLIDVRTPQEWAEAGLPDAEKLPCLLLCLTWRPGEEADFAVDLQQAVPDHDRPLLFLCRSGVRSQSAGHVAQLAGYTDITNIADGFEDRHGPGTGWKASGLPITYRPLSGS